MLSALKTRVRDLLPLSCQVPVKYWYGWLRGGLEEEMKILGPLVRSTDRVIDVGANRGVYAYRLWRLGAQVEAFEPNPVCLGVLKAWASGKSAIRLHSVALSSNSGRANLRIPIDESGVEHDASASIEKAGITRARDESVPLRTLDSYGFEGVSLIKIDVEGHEQSVIEGAASTIAASTPALLVEIEQRHIARPIGEVFERILGFGYRGFFMSEGRLVPLEGFEVARHQAMENFGGLKAAYVNNFLFLHRDKLAGGAYGALVEAPRSRMRVAVVSNTAWYLFNFRLNLMRALQAEGHAVVAVAPEDAYADKIRAAGVAFEGVRISGGGINPLAELRSVLGLWSLFRLPRPGGRIDLVLSYTPKGNLYSALACIAARVPFVANVSGLGRTAIRRSIATPVVELLYRMTLRRARRVFFQNNDDLESFVRKGLVRKDHAERLPGSGVDLNRFQPAGAAPARDADAPIFLLMARLMWDKGVGEFAEAARIVKSRHPRARFQLLGFLNVANPSAISRPQMDAWAAEGLIEYQGITDDVRPWIAQADCVVLPSYREGVPRTLLEAAAMARPIVTTDAPGCRDTVIDGETGFLCRAADAEDLADKLLRFAALSVEERDAMGLRGREFVEKKFDERFVLRRYLEVVRTLA